VRLEFPTPADAMAMGTATSCPALAWAHRDGGIGNRAFDTASRTAEADERRLSWGSWRQADAQALEGARSERAAHALLTGGDGASLGPPYSKELWLDFEWDT